VMVTRDRRIHTILSRDDPWAPADLICKLYKGGRLGRKS
jgi:hypothetical protein